MGGLALQADSNIALVQLQREVEQEIAKASRPPEPKPPAKSRELYPDKPVPAKATVDSDSDSSSSSSDCGRDPRNQYFKKKEPRPLTEEEIPNKELCDAVRSGDKKELERLLESGVVKNVNWRRPEDGNTALHVAAEEGHGAVVRALLAA